MEKLKKCPLCGGELTLFDWKGEEITLSMLENKKLPQQFCAGCDCGFNFELGEKVYLAKFIERLNTRKPMERIVEQLEANSEWTDSTFDEDGYSNDDSFEVVRLDKAIKIVKEEM